MTTDNNAIEAIEALASELWSDSNPDMPVRDCDAWQECIGLARRALNRAAPILEANVRAKIAEDIAEAIAATCLQVTWPDGRTSLKLAEVMDAARNHYEAIARQHAQRPAETAATGQTGPDTCAAKADSPKPAETLTAARALFRDCPECGAHVTGVAVDQTLAITSMPCGHVEANEGSRP